MENKAKLDRYKLLKKIGEGAYGKVYRAKGEFRTQKVLKVF